MIPVTLSCNFGLWKKERKEKKLNEMGGEKKRGGGERKEDMRISIR